MIRLAQIIETFEAEFIAQYQHALLPGHYQALSAIKHCRSSASHLLQARCDSCQHTALVPHSCGHRSCPHCQHHESEQWLQRQLHKQLPVNYFLLTFTLPREFRTLAWQHQRIVYDQMLRCSWETVQTFAANDPQLSGCAGAISVLHTHSRRLDYHPHVHLVVPAGCVDQKARRWRTKRSQFLFPQRALAKVFRAKLLDALTRQGLALPLHYPRNWVVDVKSVGSGDKALIYLGRYLYKGVISEKDIIACREGQVTYRFRNSKTQRYDYRTVPGARFLWLVIQHVLPRGLRRTRNHGFLHANSKHLIKLLQWLLGFCPMPLPLKKRPALTCRCCGGAMGVVKTRLPPLISPEPRTGTVLM